MMNHKSKKVIMKNKLFLIIALFLVAIVSGYSQHIGDKVFTLDTLDDSETLTFLSTTTFDYPGKITYHVAADSIDGTPTGTIYYEWSLDKDGVEWYTAATDTITNGAETNQMYILTNTPVRRARIRIVGAATQEVEISPAILYMRDR